MDRQDDKREAKVVRVPAAARALDTTPGNIYKHVREGHIKAHRLGRAIYIPKAEIDRLTQA